MWGEKGQSFPFRKFLKIKEINKCIGNIFAFEITFTNWNLQL